MKRRILVWITVFLYMGCACVAADHGRATWVGSWAASPLLMHIKEPLDDSTVRNVVHLTLGGNAVRITVTNQFGAAPLLIGSASIAASAGGGTLQPGSSLPLTFNRQLSVTIPAGAYVLSDPVPMPLAAFSDLVVSFYLPQQTITDPTCHQDGMSTNFIAAGNEAASIELRDAHRLLSWCFLQSVEVRPEKKNAAAVVALGDSITDGAHSTLDANHRYPDYLALRLHASRKTAHLSVLNEGISGGRVLFDGHGPSALARFDRDVLAQPNVRYVIYLEGINDIGQILRPSSPESTLTADELIFAATQLVTRAHQHGIKVFGATLLPFSPKLLLASPEKSRAWQVIEQYNEWVRNSHEFDGVVDFAKAVADPRAPQTMLPRYDCGDHVHPNDAGYKAMADAVDLSLFR